MFAENIFLKIIAKEIAVDFIHEDEDCLAFNDKCPQAPIHILIIPRKVIRTHADIKEEDNHVLGRMHTVAKEIARRLGLENGYRLIINCDSSAGQTVPHLHMHLLGGRDFSWPPG